MAKHQSDSPAAKRYTTIMTQEGVSDPTLLSPEGQLIHARRLGGPGTRSKNPKKFDAMKSQYDALNAQKNENRRNATKRR
jgi:hypothetical protein